MARKDADIDDDIIDLTELIESGDRGDGRTSPAPLDETEDEDFAAILAETTGTSAKAVDPDEELDMSGMGGIDNLLESLDMPPQPKAEAHKAAVPGNELDSVLDDLLGSNEPGPDTHAHSQAASPSGTHKAAKAADPEDELDALLDEKPAKAAPAPAEDLDALPDAEPTPSKAPQADDLDLLFDSPSPQKPAASANKPAKSEEPGAMPDLDADLDDLLSSFDEKPPAAPVPPKADESSLAADIDDILGEVEPPAPPPQPEAAPPEPEVAEDLNLPGSPSNDEIDVPDELDQMLEDSAKSESLPAQMQEDLLPVKGPAEKAAVPMQAYTLSPETLAGLCRNLGPADTAHQQALQEFSRELGGQSAHIEDLGTQLAQLGRRLLACESKLSAARARIASLEKAMESTAAIEDLLKEGSSLHTGFMGLISAAVSNALQGFSIPYSNVQDQVDNLDKNVGSIAERLKQLESNVSELNGSTDISRLIENNDNYEARLQAIEKKFAAFEQISGKELEKAAAAAAAKVLREEISRLAQG